MGHDDAENSLGREVWGCYDFFAFVALVTPLDSKEGAASTRLRPLFVVRLEAVGEQQIAHIKESKRSERTRNSEVV
jgi:hypothetical protein